MKFTQEIPSQWKFINIGIILIEINITQKEFKTQSWSKCPTPKEIINWSPTFWDNSDAPSPNEANRGHLATSQEQRDQNSKICLRFDTDLWRSLSTLKYHDFNWEH